MCRTSHPCGRNSHEHQQLGVAQGWGALLGPTVLSPDRDTTTPPFLPSSLLGAAGPLPVLGEAVQVKVLLAVVLKADIRSHLGLCGTQGKGHVEPKPTASRQHQHQWPHFMVSSHGTLARDAGGGPQLSNTLARGTRAPDTSSSTGVGGGHKEGG